MQEAHTTGGRGIPQIELPQKLGVVVPPGQDVESVWKMLVASGLSTGEHAGRAPVLVHAGADGLEALPAWLEQHPEGHILLLFNAPVPTIARHMADRVEPADAIAQWHQHAEQVLGVIRHNRRRMTLIALEAAQADPGAFTELLGNRFGLALKRPLDTIEAGENPGAVFRMMAENAVWQSPEVRNLAAELEANALPMPPSHGLLLPAVEEVYSEFNTLVERTRARKEAYKAELEKTRQRLKDREEENAQDQERKKALEEENELLLQQLHQAQEELEATLAQNGQLTENPKNVQTEAAQAQASDDASSNARIRDLEEENELLLQQLHHVQEELESYFLENRDLQRKLDEAQKQQKEFEIQARKATNMLNDVHASISWKITAPLRFFVSPFMRGDRAASRKQ